MAGNARLADIRVSHGDTLVDMGDDDFTQGRPHLMIDPSLRNERIERDAADPATAVLLIDVVLGYGSAADPTTRLIEVLGRGAARSATAAGHLAVVAHVRDRRRPAEPQGHDRQAARRRRAGGVEQRRSRRPGGWLAGRLAGR